MGIASGLSIGARTLQAYQVAMQVIGHNIANASTPGYSRQEAILTTSEPDRLACGAVGTGVDISDVRRVRDAYLDIRMQRETAALNKWQAREDSLSQLELYFKEPSDSSLSTYLSEFWNSWQELSNGPEDQVNRVSLVQQTLLLTNGLNDTASKMEQLRLNIDETVQTKVAQVNSLADQIAALNGQIISFENGGKTAGDLRDKREELVTELSSLIDFTLYSHSNGAYAIDIGGKPLVWDTTANHMSTEKNPDDPQFLSKVIWEEGGSDVDISSGEIGGLMYSRDEIVPEYSEKLDTLVRSLMSAINDDYSRGFGLTGFSSLSSLNAVTDPGIALASEASGLDDSGRIVPGSITLTVTGPDGTRTPTQINITAATTLNDIVSAIGADDATGIAHVSASVSGGKLVIEAGDGYSFQVTDGPVPTRLLSALGVNTFFTGTGASDITVNSLLQEEPDKIAAGRTGEPGDNANAISILRLKDGLMMSNSTSTFGNFYSSDIIGALGVSTTEAERMVEGQQLIVNQVSDNIDGISGVSLDEEMSLMIQYEHAYAAAAKYVGMVGQMLDSLTEII